MQWRVVDHKQGGGIFPRSIPQHDLRMGRHGDRVGFAKCVRHMIDHGKPSALNTVDNSTLSD